MFQIYIFPDVYFLCNFLYFVANLCYTMKAESHPERSIYIKSVIPSGAAAHVSILVANARIFCHFCK